MSRHRDLLISLVALGKTPHNIAAEVPMGVRNVNSTLKDDWPIQKRYIDPLEAYGERVLRLAYSMAEGATKSEIAAHYVAAFGESIHDAQHGYRALRAAAKRATYVAWLLGMRVDEVFPTGRPDSSAVGDRQLVTYVRDKLTMLRKEASTRTDFSPEATRYLSALFHADDVLEERVDPVDNGWFDNEMGQRRGRYVFAARGGRRTVHP